MKTNGFILGSFRYGETGAGKALFNRREFYGALFSDMTYEEKIRFEKDLDKILKECGGKSKWQRKI
jgi:hypothetical protein